MHYYEIAWSWHDDYCPVILTNEEYFEEQKFKEIVNKSVRNAFDKIYEEESKKNVLNKSYIGFCEWDRITNIVIEELKKYGFEKLKITNKVNYFGLYILEEYDTKYNRESVEEAFHKTSIPKILEFNQQQEKEIIEIIEKEKTERTKNKT